jgi:plasmid stability protein
VGLLPTIWRATWQAVVLCAVRNITVAVPDETYRKAKVRAAEMDTSVSALVRDFLEQVAGEESDFERRRRLQQEVLGSIRRFRAGDRLKRDEVHERRALR